MSTNSKIEWTEQTWNPIAGCTRVSPGCQNCYAERMAKRLIAMGQEKYFGTIDKNGRWSGELSFDVDNWNAPLKRKKPTTYFVNSMSDLFHEKVLFNWHMRIWDVMRDTPQHTYQILTKRADIMARRSKALTEIYGVLPNVWLGVSVENQKYADERIPYLLQTPAAVRFLSCEPLLGPVVLPSWDSYIFHDGFGNNGPMTTNIGYSFEPDNLINWVIVGGESGPNARPMHPDWARGLRDQCTGAGVPFFFKQWGEWVVDEKLSTNPTPGMEVFRKVGKHAAGRLLDGRTWDEFPK